MTMLRLSVHNLAAACVFLCLAQSEALAEPRLPDLVCEIYAVTHGSANGQPALRFGTWAVNLGAGPIELHADSTQPGTTNVFQWIYDTDPEVQPTKTLVGNFVVDQSNRVRFADSADFFLREVMEDDSVGGIVGANEKVAYCFVDSHQYVPSPPGTPNARVYGGQGPGTFPACGTVLGTSVGWVDDYPNWFSGQYIYLAGISSGTYWLENILDPLNRIVESNNSNNFAKMKVTVSSGFAPEMNLFGNGQAIVDGDATPAASDHTDFGYADLANGTVTRTFTIQNSGSGSLSLTGVPRAKIVGSGDFTVLTQPASPVAPGANATFQISFDPSGMNATAEVLILNNDANEAPYSFAIRGNANTGNADADDDGMPDEWETLYQLSDPVGNEDGDALSNLDEFIAGTSPRDANSVFRFKRTEHNGTANHLTWDSVSGRNYKLHASNDLSAAMPWPLMGEWAGTGGEITGIDGSLGSEPRYYRLTVGF